MKIKDIMITRVISVNPEASVSEVADILYKNKIHALPVIKKGKIVGIITENDFFVKGKEELFLPAYVKFLKASDRSNLPPDVNDSIDHLLKIKAHDLMTTKCVTVTMDMDVSKFMALVKKTKFTTFPVVDEKQNLIGIVTLSDVLGTVKSNSKKMADFSQHHSAKIATWASRVDSFWSKRVVIMSKQKIRTWQGVLIIGFLAGALSAVILSVSSGIETKSIAAAESNLYFQPTNSTVNIDQDFTLDAMINPGSNKITAVELHVTYDQTKLRLDNVSNSGSPFTTVLKSATIDNNSGTASIILGITPVVPVVATTKIATFSFHSLAAGSNIPVAFATTSIASAIGESSNVVVSRAGAKIAISPPLDTIAPTVSITSPANNASVSGSVNVAANANDNVGVTKLDFLVDGNVKSSDTTSPYSYSLDTASLSNGAHQLTAKAYDAAGNVSTSSTVVVNVNNATSPPPNNDTSAPTVTISKPVNGSVFSGVVAISASAADNTGVSSMVCYVDNTRISSSTSGSINCNWNTKKQTSGSSHVIKVEAKDAAGNIGSASVNITISNTGGGKKR